MIKNIDRRGFLRRGIAGAAGVMPFAPSIITARGIQQDEIIYRPYGYSNPSMAHSPLSEIGTPDNPCSDYSGCKVACVKNFRIREKIADISRLVAVPGEFLV